MSAEEIAATKQFIDVFITKINDITNNTIMTELQKKTYKDIFITLLREIQTQKYEYLDEAYKKKLNDLLDTPSSEGGKRKSKKYTSFRKGITKYTFKKSKKSKKRQSKKFRR